MEFQTMPLRFRVWDEEDKAFRTRNGSIEFSVTDLVVFARDNEFTLKDVYVKENGGLQDKFIISQDTGLKDKNGKAIFTGDIYQSARGAKYLVSYEPGTSFFKILPGFVDWGKKFKAREGRVIGNIWQNPELLEDK